jgi:putative RecB family exonuclease
LKYKYEYIDKMEIEEMESIETFLGSRVHEALRKLYQDVRFTKIPTLEEVLAYYNDQWKKNWNENIHIVKSEYEPENYRRMGERYIEMYYKRYHPFNKGIIVGLEYRVIINLNPEGTYKLQGYIDRLMKVGDGIYEIHDYKTSSSPPTKEQFEQDRQLALYSIAVKQMFTDVKRVDLVWHYLAFDQEIRSTRTEEQLSRLKEEVNRIIQEIERAERNGEFPPKPSRLCDYCAYAFICPLQAHIQKTSAMPPNEYLNEPGVKLVNKYAELTQKKKEFIEQIDTEIEKVKEALFEYAKNNNLEVVAGSDVKARLKVFTNIEFPYKNTKEREELEKIIREAGKWNEVSSLDVFTLSRIVKTKEWSSELLKKIEKFQSTKEIKKVFLSKFERENEENNCSVKR